MIERILNLQIYINIALCCFYAQQFDLSITCVERALQLSKDDATTADIWYNLSHIAIVSSLIKRRKSQLCRLRSFQNVGHC